MEFLKANIEAGKVYVCLVVELSTRQITSATWTADVNRQLVRSTP